MLAFRSRELDIYQVMQNMSKRGWNLNGLHKPPCVHICVTLRHTQPGVAERFGEDLQAAVAEARRHPGAREGLAPIYGLAATMPLRGLVGDMLKHYMDLLYKV